MFPIIFYTFFLKYHRNFPHHFLSYTIPILGLTAFFLKSVEIYYEILEKLSFLHLLKMLYLNLSP